MKIGIDASRANKKIKTGVEWYSYHLIEEFKKIDSSNRFFLYTNCAFDEVLGKCPANFEERLLQWPIPRSWTLGRLSLEMKFGREIPDLLFVPAHTIPLLNPKKSVVTIHDIGFEHIPEAYHWANKLYHKFIIHFIKIFASHIITVSNYTKQDLIATYNIPAEKISVVYNGYDEEKYSIIPDAKEKLKEKFKIDYPFILFVGRLELKKNIVRMVEAFGLFRKRHPDDPRKLVLIGQAGIDNGLELAKEKIKELNIENDVVFTGWLGSSDLPLFHNAADLFFFPSLFEGFGIPLLESFACGCPVVCSSTTSLPEVAGDAALMFDPTNIDDMVGRLEQVLLNKEIQDRLREKGLARVKNFSWNKCARETLKILLDQGNNNNL